MRNFKDLSVWQRSHALTLKNYQYTKTYPKEELFGLTSQMRRSASSIPTNIAEGAGRNSNAEMKHYLIIARGSASELEYQIILSHDLMYLPDNVYIELNTELSEIQKMIYGFIRNMV
jgi:four helix bundle protein